MPIYAYKCSACGFAKDALQKLSDPLLTTCPECGQETFSKQVTAAGFQLKGSGWYVTDFRNNGSAPATGAAPSRKSEGDAKSGADTGSKAAPESKSETKSSSDSTSAAPAASSAGGSASSSTPSASA